MNIVWAGDDARAQQVERRVLYGHFAMKHPLNVGVVVILQEVVTERWQIVILQQKNKKDGDLAQSNVADGRHRRPKQNQPPSRTF